MSVVDQQSDTWGCGGIVRVELDAVCLLLFPLFLKQLLIELDQKQSLVANVCKEVILPDKVKDIGPPQPQEELKCFPRLAIRDVPVESKSCFFLTIVHMLTVQRGTPLGLLYLDRQRPP